MHDETRQVNQDLVDLLAPLDVRSRAMFGGYCVYIADTVVGLVCDGAVFIKRSSRDELLEGWATLSPAYPGAKDTWKLPSTACHDESERVLAIVDQVAAALPAKNRNQPPQSRV